jgi:hypothetical protein
MWKAKNNFDAEKDDLEGKIDMLNSKLKKV